MPKKLLSNHFKTISPISPSSKVERKDTNWHSAMLDELMLCCGVTLGLWFLVLQVSMLPRKMDI
jgi:hypothetical protein